MDNVYLVHIHVLIVIKMECAKVVFIRFHQYLPKKVYAFHALFLNAPNVSKIIKTNVKFVYQGICQII